MENQQNENFANCSQTSFAMRKFRKPVSQCENFANQNSQCENFAMRNFAMPKPSSQCQMQFRNTQFAMRKFRKANFAVRNSISQCQNTIHLSQPMRNFALRNSQPLCEISQTHFALRNSPCEIFRPCHPL